MRIIAGKHKGRRIDIGKGAAHVRPTSGFTRQAIFNIISHGEYAGDGNSPLIGKRVADICCGSGAFGLEALSRGAAHATFVDMDHHALLAARNNAERMNETPHVSFLRANVSNLPAAPLPYGLIFIDPPYFGGLIPPCLNGIATQGWADAQTLIIIEHDEKEQVPLPAAYTQLDERHYGRATVRLLKLNSL